jgi:ubiquinone biosynthesis monooxygenase Coq7
MAAKPEDSMTAPDTGLDAPFTEPPVETASPRAPGDPDKAALLSRMIRVDHAGEYGAARIYAGQIAVLGHTDKGPILQHMKDQEQVHLDTFSAAIADRGVRPTALLPFWHVAGFVLGAGTALMGPRAAMACTVAVEEVIDEHYAEQAAALGEDEKPLRDTIEQFRREEIEHRDIGLAHEAEKTPGYRILTAVIKAGCKVAIRLSERV